MSFAMKSCWQYSHDPAVVQSEMFPYLPKLGAREVSYCYFPETDLRGVVPREGYSFFPDKNGRWVLRAFAGGPVNTSYGKVDGFAVWTTWKEQP